MSGATRWLARTLAASLAAAGPSQAEIKGAGATTPAQVLQEWAKAYRAAPVTHDAVGSGEGLRRVRAKAVAFCVSDMALSVPELQASELAQFPVLLGGIVPIVNLKGVTTGRIRLSGSTLAGIYLGRINTWNDPAIAALNPGVALPADSIRPVHRAEKSGASFVFTATSLASATSGRRASGPGWRSSGRRARRVRGATASSPACSVRRAWARQIKTSASKLVWHVQ